MLTDLMRYVWELQRACSPDFDPEPHWENILGAWKRDEDPAAAGKCLSEGRQPWWKNYG